MPERFALPERHLPSEYVIEELAGSTLVAPDDVLALWAREGAVPPAEAARRVHEVHMVATHVRDGVVSVASRYLQRNDQLGVDLWYGRLFTAAAHRMHEIAVQVGVVATDRTEADFVAGRDRRAIGMGIEVENEDLKQGFPLGMWPGDWAYIGDNERGDHVRVHYFAGAEIPDFHPRTPEPVPGERRVEVVRGALDGARADALLALWARHGVLEGEAARARLPHVVAVLVQDDEVVGSSSAVVTPVPVLGNRPFWLYRRFAPGLEGTPDDAALFVATFEALDVDRTIAPTEPAGLYTVVEEATAIEPSPAAMWPETELVHVARLPDRRFGRVCYFLDSVIA